MPITGKFEADFSQFSTAVREADVQLKSFESDSQKVASALGRMTDQFSGRRVIQDATLMAEAVERIGGVSKLTEAELARLGNTAQEAVNKMKALGTEVPANLQKIADAAKNATAATAATTTGLGVVAEGAGKSTNAFNSLATSLATADKTLGAAGVHIGPEIQALNELAGAVGKTATAFGVLGTAGLIIGTGMAAWNLGRKIAEVTGLDDKVVALTDHILGQGLAAQTAGAQQDSINLAISRGAPTTVTYTEAIAFNTKQQKEWADSLDKSKKKVDDVDAATKQHADTMKRFNESLAASNEAYRKAEEVTRGLAAARSEEIDRIQKISDSLTGRDVLASMADMAKAIGDVGNIAGYAADQQAKIAEMSTKAIEALLRNGDVANPLIAIYAGLYAEATKYVDAQRQLAAATATATAEQKRQTDEMLRAFTASGGTDVAGFNAGLVVTGRSALLPSVGLKPSAFADGGINASAYGASSGVQVNRTLYSDRVSAPSSAPGVVMNNTFHVNGTPEESARKMVPILTRDLSVGTQYSVTR